MMESTQANNTTSWSGREGAAPDANRARDRRHALAGDYHEAHEQYAAKNWVREHQDVALIAAFVLGVFVGAWMRS